jgi:hypothetical protein
MKWIDGNPYEICAVIAIMAVYIWAKLSLRKEQKENEKSN